MLRIVLTATLLCASQAAFAQELTAEQRSACMGDYEKFCKGTTPGDGRIIACLARSNDKLTPACKKVLADDRKNKSARRDFGSSRAGKLIIQPGMYCQFEERDRAYRRDRRRPRRPLLRLSLEKTSPRRRDRSVRAEPRRRHLGLRRGVLRAGAGIPARRRSRHRRRHHAEDGELEEHHAQSARRKRRDRRRRLFLDRPARSAHDPAAARVRAVGVTPRYDTTIQSLDQLDRLRSDRRGRRPELAGAPQLRGRLRRIGVPFRQQVRLVRHHQTLRDAVADLCREPTSGRSTRTIIGTRPT